MGIATLPPYGAGFSSVTRPAGRRDGMNMYAYVRNNPLRYTDPDGLTARWKVNSADFGLGGGDKPRSERH